MKLNYKELGEGKPLVIVHGLFGSLDNWITHGKRFAELGYHVFLVDQRNHGRSPHSEEFTYEAMSSDLLEFINDHIKKPVSIIGHSMGGKTAMHFAKDHPDYIEKLIVVDIGPKYYPPHHESVISAFNAVDPATLSSRSEGDKIMLEYIKEPGVRMFLLKNLIRAESNNFSWKMNLPVITKNIEEVGKEQSALGEIPVRTLFIHGGNSDYILRSDKPIIREQFTNCTFVEISGAGHWVHAEQSESFFLTAKTFLDE